MEERYLFYSNYPYFEALHLGRFIQGQANIESGLKSGANPTQQVCHMAFHAGNVVFKEQLFDPGNSAEAFARQQEEKARFDALSEEEREREMEEMAARLRQGGFDDDDADYAWTRPVKDRDRVVEFVRLSHSQLLRIAEFAVPGDSLLEDMVTQYIDEPKTRQQLRGFYGLMTAWDLMRMRHEGKPPYSISFAPTFADSLEEILEEEGDPNPDVGDILDRLSRPRPFRLKPRDFKVARAGIRRAQTAGVIDESDALSLLRQLNAWK